MSDVGAADRELAKKRASTELRRLEYQVERDELEKLETLDRVKKIDENIKASKEALKEQENMLAELEGSEDS